MSLQRGAGDEARSPKYAHVERERRWLVDPGKAPALHECAAVTVEDRYLHGTRLRLRRMIDPASGRTVLKLTKKYVCDDAAARPIVTTYLTAEEYERFADLPADSLRKTRVALPGDFEGWSLDVFDPPLSGLLILEAEASDPAALSSLQPPIWAGREIGGDPDLEGRALARRAEKGAV